MLNFFINFLQWEKQSIISNIVPVLLTILQFLVYQILILADIFSVSFPKENQEIHTGAQNKIYSWNGISRGRTITHTQIYKDRLIKIL